MTKKLKLVMATNNAGKLREARAIAGDKIDILSLEDIGYDKDIEETADTLEGNALIKVRAIKEASGLNCFADDTGLMVDALWGAPGVHTARYAGEECNPDKNIDLLLKNLEGADDRSARFCTCVALSLDGEEHVFEGSVEGKIAEERSGTHGFGYDPVFIPNETGICFADMSDEAKNAISHRGRAITAMMKWLSALCLCLFSIIRTDAAVSNDWRLFNTFDDKIDNVFDTPDKTYFVVQGQYQDPEYPDNSEKLSFLFCLDKESGEIRPYNPGNFLSGSIIRQASYNAQKNYLLIIYEDQTIDILFDNGDKKTLTELKNFKTSSSKEVRSISFDADSDRAYIATEFGYLAIDDKKYQVAISGIYDTPIDRMARLSDKLLIVRNGKLYYDDLASRHTSINDFKELNWNEGSDAIDLIPLSPTKCIVSKNYNGQETHYILTWDAADSSPESTRIGNYGGSKIAENKDGQLFTVNSHIIQVDRETGKTTAFNRRAEDNSVACGSWDLRDFYFIKSRAGIYSLHRNDDATWTVTSDVVRPDAPAVFRSDALMYSKEHGMLANTHGQSQSFKSHLAKNPILLSGFKDGSWSMYGLPYLNADMETRLINPCGFAQDPDDPDIFYFGSVLNGLIRYNIKDGSSLLHVTRSNDSSQLPGHVGVQQPYKEWSSRFHLLCPIFDSKGNLVVAHVNSEGTAVPEIWIWTPEQRKASTSPETFQPFTRLKIDGFNISKNNLALPLTAANHRDMIIFFPLNFYQKPFAVYDHNGTPEIESDDKQVVIKDLEDSDGSVSYNYLYCAIEDPATGLVWIGSDNGVFTFDPGDAFTHPGRVSRIKVSRNDGTSLADYLLAGTSVNDISIDGMGRKWFALSGGGIVCTSADGKTILQEITSENSMLPSDIVYTSCYNPDNNSMMIATASGLCEYYLNGQSTETEQSSVRAYPNPVRHDYYGWVTIDGLEEDCIVKIADSAGNIVRELGPASAGKVQWDVCGMDLNRVPSGVYFVLASSGPGGGSYSEATKILVINR
ncbi:MAG: RdgB/HAM1 family non-canonical purine NTP pyrophosphatase [Muribaculaceae bacterium]|nr:RdgB/HAM1 family non-canonical purine NTP pyrophosphatase [Muribaculaceae bacterium]